MVGTREGYMKRSRDKAREEEEEVVTKETKGSLSFSFVSLESFPLPPLEEAAAPATETNINRALQLFSVTVDSLK